MSTYRNDGEFDVRFRWISPYYRQLSRESGFASMDTATRWTTLQRRLLSAEQPNLGRVLAQMDKISAAARRRFLEWLLMPLTPLTSERMWTIRSSDGTILACDLKDHGSIGVDVQKLRNGQFLFGRRWPDRTAALVEVDAAKSDHLAHGGVLLD
jgi:hypothetical protein